MSIPPSVQADMEVFVPEQTFIITSKLDVTYTSHADGSITLNYTTEGGLQMPRYASSRNRSRPAFPLYRPQWQLMSSIHREVELNLRRKLLYVTIRRSL